MATLHKLKLLHEASARRKSVGFVCKRYVRKSRPFRGGYPGREGPFPVEAVCVKTRRLLPSRSAEGNFSRNPRLCAVRGLEIRAGFYALGVFTQSGSLWSLPSRQRARRLCASMGRGALLYAASISVGSSSPTPARLTRGDTIHSCNTFSAAGRSKLAGLAPRIQALASCQSRMIGIRS